MVEGKLLKLQKKKKIVMQLSRKVKNPQEIKNKKQKKGNFWILFFYNVSF